MTDNTMVSASDIPPRPKRTVRTIVFYNPFNPTDRQIIDTRWGKRKTVAQYLGKLPDEVNWGVVAGGRELSREEWKTTTLTQDDSIVLVANPEKGVGRILLMLAIVVVAAVVAGPIGAATGLTALVGATVATAIVMGVITTVGGMLVNALLPAETEKPSTKETKESTSYGLDGPKPTSKEELPVPVTYGLYRQGGNRINYYGENSADGKTQTLYMQYAVSEGEIEEISDILINDQPVSNFRDVQIETRMGTLDQQPLSWFTDTVTPYAQNVTLTETYSTYTTVGEVDRVGIDITYPQGTFEIAKKNGSRNPFGGSVIIELQPLAGGPSTFISQPAWSSVTLDGSGVASSTGEDLRLTVRVTGENGSSPQTDYYADIKVWAGDTLVVDEQRTGVVQNEYVRDGEWRAGTQDFFFETGAIEDGTQFRVEVSGGTVIDTEVRNTQGIGGLWVWRDERNPFRVSYDSGPLTRGRYVVKVKRGQPEENSDTKQNKSVWSGVNEIIADRIAYRSTAYYAVKIRLSEQLSNEPTVTALVKGRKVNIYDSNGNVSDYRWSDNPADISLDMMLHPRWGSRISTSRIDFPAFVRWRNFCTANGLKFNGTFDFLGNLWDALRIVSRVGRASLVVSGLRWTVAVEGPAEASMIFGSHNMIKGSFKNYWVGRQGRSNHIEAQYYDAADNYRRNSVFSVDEAALARGEPLRQSTINLIGVTDATQAQKEADLQRNLNSGVQQGCRFSAHMDAIGCTIGDVIYVQHDMPKWGWADRIKSVNWPSITIENGMVPAGNTQMPPETPSVPLPEGEWRVLVLKPAIHAATLTVVNASGKQIIVGGVAPANTRRVIIGGNDYQVLDTVVSGGNTTFLLDRSAGSVIGQAAQLWQIDQLLEGWISRPNEWATELTLTSWAHDPQRIEPGDQVMIGRVGKYKRPFRVIKFSHDSEQARQIDCIEYNEAIYTASGVVPPTNYSETPTAPLHVINLRAEQINQDVAGGGVRHFARASWDLPLNDQRGHAGSKVWIKVNSNPFRFYEKVDLGRSESLYEGNVGDVVRFKVVAFDQSGADANINTAPVATVTLDQRQRAPLPPTGFTATGGFREISLRWTLPADEDIKQIEVWEAATNDLNAAGMIDAGMKNFFPRTGLGTNVTRYYWIRSLSYSNIPSLWVGPQSATTSFLVTDDINNYILTTAKFAQNIKPVELVDTLPASADENTVVLLKSNGKLYTRKGGVWVATVQPLGPNDTLTSEQIQSLQAAKIAGQLTNEQLADIDGAKVVGEITNANLDASRLVGQISADAFGEDLRPIEVVDSLPLTGNFPNRVVILSTDHLIYRFNGSGWVNTLPADKIDGLITNAQIDSIDPAKLSSQITSAMIAGIDASKIDGTLTPEQIGIIDAANLAGQITSTQIADDAIDTPQLKAGAVTAAKIGAGEILAGNIHAGAITTEKLDAEAVTAAKIKAGDIDASHLASGSVTTEKLAVGSASGNLVWNACMATSTSGWSVTHEAASPGLSLTPALSDSVWRLAGNGTAILNYPGTLANGVRILANWDSHGDAIPVQAGEWWEFQARVQNYRCNARLELIWFNASGGYISESYPASKTGDSTPGAGKALENYALLWGKAQAPSGAVKMLARIAGVGKGIADPYIFFTQVQICPATANQATPNPWSPGGVTQIESGMIRANTITGDALTVGAVTADKIQTGTITADQIAGDTITGNKIKAGTIQADQLASNSVNADKIVGGSITGDKIAAKAITASKLTLVPTSLVLDAYFQDPASWVADAGAWYFDAANGSNGLDSLGVPAGIVLGSGAGYTGTGAAQVASTARIPVTEGERLTFRVLGSNGGNKIINAFIAYVSATGSYVGGSHVLSWAPTQGGKKEIQSVVIADAAHAFPVFYVDAGVAWSGGAIFSDVVLVRPASAEMIIDGAIKANKIEAGAVTVGKLAADAVVADNIAALQVTAAKIAGGAVETDKLAAGAVTTEKLSVGPASGNLVWNSCLAGSASGWSFGEVGGASYLGGAVGVGDGASLSPLWRLAGLGSGYMEVPGTLAGTQQVSADWTGTEGYIPVEPGQWWGFQARLQAHRCRAELQLIWLTGSGVFLGASTIGHVDAGVHGGGQTLSQYGFLWGKAQVPVGAARMVPRIALQGLSGFGSASDAHPYVFWTQTQVCPANVNQAEATPWAAGGVTQIDGGMIRTNSIEAGTLKAGAVQAGNLAVDAVTAGTIGVGAVNAREIATGAIRADKLASEEIVTQSLQLRNLVIGESKIQGDAVSHMWGADVPIEDLYGIQYGWTGGFTALSVNSDSYRTGLIQLFVQHSYNAAASVNTNTQYWIYNNGIEVAAHGGIALADSFILWGHAGFAQGVNTINLHFANGPNAGVRRVRMAAFARGK